MDGLLSQQHFFRGVERVGTIMLAKTSHTIVVGAVPGLGVDYKSCLKHANSHSGSNFFMRYWVNWIWAWYDL